jgi:hypothetical protein
LPLFEQCRPVNECDDCGQALGVLALDQGVEHIAGFGSEFRRRHARDRRTLDLRNGIAAQQAFIMRPTLEVLERIDGFGLGARWLAAAMSDSR